MNAHALLHVMDSPLCFPVSSDEMIIRLRTAKDDVDKVTCIYESKYVIGKKQKYASMHKAYSGALFDFYEVKLKLKDTRIGYVFFVESGNEKYYFSEDGISETYDFRLGYYNFFQYPYINEVDIVKPVEWMKTAVFYQIFVDRFNMGDKEKDFSYINLKWGGVPTPKSFAGGDLKGITEKLDYIKSLGADSIYLTPVFKSISNHKYDISDYYRVDPQFGSNEDLKELIMEAHKRDMHIVLDAVFNHCSDELMQFKDVKEKGVRSKYYNWFFVYGDSVDFEKHNYETFASCRYMPKFNTSNPEVRDFLIGIGTYYIKEYGIDGWRLDVSDEISYDFWREFRKAIKGANPEAVIIGENWHDANINLRGDQYDSIMNYAFTKTCLDYFAWHKKNAYETACKFNDILMRNKDGINKMMLNLLDSHDTHRFFTETGENRSSFESALGMLYFFVGAPCIFYGTETLTVGGYDPDCRRCMDWEKAKKKDGCKDVYKLLNSLAKIKRIKGFADSSINIYSEDDILIVKRTYKKMSFVLLTNQTDKEKTYDGNKISPNGFIVLKNGRVMIDE